MSTTNFNLDTMTNSEMSVGDWQNNLKDTVNGNAAILDAAISTATIGNVFTSAGVSAIYTMSATETFLDSMGTWTIGLPASPTTGRMVTIFAGAATITINGNANNINGAATTTIVPLAAKTFVKRTTADWIAF